MVLRLLQEWWRVSISWRDAATVLTRTASGATGPSHAWQSSCPGRCALSVQCRAHVLMGLPNPDPLVRGTDPDPDPLVKRGGSGSAPKWVSSTLVSTPFLQIFFLFFAHIANSLLSSVLYKHRFDADPDQDPTFHFDAYPYLDTGPAPSFTHVGKSEIFLTFILSTVHGFIFLSCRCHR